MKLARVFVGGRELRWYFSRMALATSKLTAQGKTSVPPEVRKRLGLRAGSMIEWTNPGSTSSFAARAVPPSMRFIARSSLAVLPGDAL